MLNSNAKLKNSGGGGGGGGGGGAVTSVAGKTGDVTLVKADVGLGNVDNTSDIAKPISNATQTALNAKVTSVAGKTGVVTLEKADVGLGNVDNTSDITKPISTATQTALNAKIDKNAPPQLPRLRGLPLLRAPKDLVGLSVIGTGVTQQIVTRNGRRAWEITLPAANGNFTGWFNIPAGTYNHKIQVEVELEKASQFNGGSLQLNVCESNAFTQARRYLRTISSAAGWNGIHQIVAPDADWVTVGVATWATISAAASPVFQLKMLTGSTVTESHKVWIYEVVKDEKDNLPMIILGADDGHVTWYSDGLPVLEKYGLKSYLAYIADPVGTTNYMTLANWQDSVARGHEVVVHGTKAGKASLRDWMTNPAPYSTALEAVTEEIKYNRDSMVANNLDPSGLGRKCYVYPQGFHQPSGAAGDNTVITALKSLGFELGRLAAKNGAFTIQPSLGATIFYLPIIGHWYSAADETANITAIINAMNIEINEGRSVILMFHIVRTTPAAAEDISVANLDKICAAIAAHVNQGKAVNRGFIDILKRLNAI